MISHIGFIMDGNRRYAKKNNISLKDAYKKGMEQFLDVIKFQINNDIKHTSFYALSTHNYDKRKREELEPIAELVEEFFKTKEIENFFIENNVKISIRGNKEKLRKDDSKLSSKHKKFLLSLEEKFEEYNKKIPNPKCFAHIALNYDGQEEILEAYKKLQEKNKKEITLQDIKENIYFNDVPSPDIIVRPGNVPRISGFLLFDSAYSEFYFTHKLWPELTIDDLLEIKTWFSDIDRNFGK